MASPPPDPESVIGIIYHNILIPAKDHLSSRDIQMELETLGENITPKVVNQRLNQLFKRKLVSRKKVHGIYVFYTPDLFKKETPVVTPSISLNTKINPSKNIGVLYHQIMKPNKAYTARMVDEEFEKIGRVIGSSSASSMLSQLASRGFALQDKSNGVSTYTRVPEDEAVPVKLDNKGRTKAKKSGKGSRAPYGQNKKDMIAALSGYIGEEFTVGNMADISGLKMNSAINGIANKLVESGQLVITGRDGRSPLYKVLPAMGQEVTPPHIPMSNRQAVETLVRPETANPFAQPHQPVAGDPLANIAGSFQILLEDHNKVKLYEQGLTQIASILASMGIIGGE